MSKTKTQLTTQTQLRTSVRHDLQQQVEIGLEQGLATTGLTAHEARALRMRYGVAHDLNAALSFADEGHPQARLQVEQLERRVVAHLQTDPDALRKQSIIEELRKI